MDPFAAIGLVSSIITFIDFGYELVSVAREIRGSATGSSIENDRIDFLNARMEATATELSAQNTTAGTTPAERRLGELSEECLRLSHDLRKLLEKIKVRDLSSKRQLIASVIRDLRKKDEKKDLETRLDKCRAQLHLQLSQASWFVLFPSYRYLPVGPPLTYSPRLESMRRLDAIATSGQCQDRELQALKQQVNALQLAMKQLYTRSGLLKDIESLLDRPRKAVDKVLQSKVLEALRFEEMHRRYDNIEEAHIDTFRWLLDDTEPLLKQDQTLLPRDELTWHLREERPLRLRAQERFLDWLRNGRGVFHISGKPGAGKSTLMKYLAESPKTQLYLQSWAGNKRVVFATFYFWRHGTDYQKSFEGLLRSLLHSVLTQCPELVSAIFPAQWEAAHDGLTIHFHKSEVRGAFDALMKQPEVYHGRKLAFFIDGLDEFEGHDDSLVAALLGWAHSGLENIKICVSSRELPIFQQRFSTYPKFRLHEITYHDILAFVNNRLQNNEDAKSPCYELEQVMRLGEQLAQKAEGVFLWVTLALRALEQGLLNGDSVALLKEKVDFLPAEVEKLFNHIFHSIQKGPHPIERKRAMRILSIVSHEIRINFPYYSALFRNETSTDLLQLSFLDEYDTDPSFSAGQFTGYLSDCKIKSRLERWHKLVNGSCMGLVTIAPGNKSRSSSRFRSHSALLAHRSLIDFFRNPDVRAQIEQHTRDFDFLKFSCQSLLAELKISVSSYLNQFQHVRRGPGTSEYFALKSRAPLPKTATRPPHALHNLTYGDLEFASEGIEFEVMRITSIYYTIKDPDISTLLSTFNQLSKLVDLDTEIYPTPTPRTLRLSFPQIWSQGYLSFGDIIEFTGGLPSEICRWIGFSLGINELWPMDDDVGATPFSKNNVMLQLVANTLMRLYWETGEAEKLGSPTFNKMLQTTSLALAKGASPNAELRLVAKQDLFHNPDTDIDSPCPHPCLTQWYLLIWHSILTTEPGVPMQALWLLFLVHGADTNFWLTFEETSDENSEDHGQEERQLIMSGEFGTERHELFTPVTVAEDHGGIVELAKKQDWTVSLSDLVCFWFPDHAEEFRALIHLNQSRVGNPSAEELKDLRQKYCFDPGAWQNREWEIPGPLLRSWFGDSHIITEDFYDTSSHATDAESISICSSDT